ncbi:MAG TPA: phosphonate ABC transporter, permease protein PhnE [Puia sp.]|jgi:phosphonate transport system permease protein|nr:phosphonate ABC transporter, permease protein PhnE [Puia sp.]
MKQPSLYTLPSTRYKRKATVFSLIAILTVGICIYLGFDPLMLFTEFHYVVDLAGNMLPPNFEMFRSNGHVWRAILETICMAFLGTIYGGSIAFVLAFLAASNTMPAWAIRQVVRFCLSLMRVIPSLVIILVFVVAIGLGPFAGMLTLVWTTIGTFGQLFTQIIENLEPAPSDAIYAIGASRVQVIRYSILPQIFPSFIANLLYSFDINMRAALAMGIFGGGGIGFELYMAMRVLRYKDALALICFTIVLITIMEKLSDHLRKKVLGAATLK